MDRRSLLLSGATLAGAGALGGSATAQQAQTALYNQVDQPLSIGPLDPRPAHRTRESFVKNLARLVNLNNFNQGAAYWNFSTYITPIEEFFVRNEFATPRAEQEARVHPRTWRLTIHGNAVERPLELTYEDLLRMPSRSIICTMECAGNGRSLFWEQQGMTADPTRVTGTGWGLGGIGQAEWRYVPLSHILGRVGVRHGAKAVLFWSGVDNRENRPGAQGDRGRPLPWETARSNADAIGLAFKMNGQDLPPDHGGPVRALVPGYCGAASTKWLTEIKIATHDFWVPLNSVAHVKIGPDYPPPKPAADDEFRFIKPDGVLGQAVTWSPPKSLLTLPLVLEKQPRFPHNYPLRPGELPTLKAESQTLSGYAWAPQHGVARVEYRIDGDGWQTARLLEPNLGRFSWVRFEFDWNPLRGRHCVETRVTDTQGQVQPETVPYNRGGFDYWGVPRFHLMAV